MQFENRLARLAQAWTRDANLRRRGARLSLRVLVATETEAYVLPFRDGVLGEILADRGPMHDWDVALRMSAADWEGFWASEPAPGWHDIFALTRGGRLVLEGNHLPLMQNLQVVKDVLALPRDQEGASA